MHRGTEQKGVCEVFIWFIADQNADYNAKKVHLDNLYRMVQYCENRTDCRRSQQMAYFGEIFDRKHCAIMRQAVCDNCSSKVFVAPFFSFLLVLYSATELC